VAAETTFHEPGTAITDEVVTCNINTTIGVGTYYAGYLLGLADRQVLGDSDATYGAWTAAAKGGTRYEVLESGVPGANQCVLDIVTGRVLTSVDDTTLYFRYVWHARLLHWWEQPIHYYKAGMVGSTSGTLDLCAEIHFPYGAGIHGAQIMADIGPTSDDYTLRIQLASGETPAQYCDYVIADAAKSSGYVQVAGSGIADGSGRLKIQPGQHLLFTSREDASLTVIPTNLTILLQPG